MNISVTEHLYLEGISSGSALEWFDDRFFVFGDDSPHLQLYTHDWHPLETIDLPGLDVQQKRIPKPTKPDIESVFLIAEDDVCTLYALGSGSVPVFRDRVFRVRWNQLARQAEVDETPAEKFYNNLRDALPDGNELNIEGAALLEDGRLVLAQRGHLNQGNYLLFTSFLNGEVFAGNTPIERSPRIRLDGAPPGAGISGLCYDAKQRKLWCCGSVEATENSYDDGEILGSFIGYFSDIASATMAEWKMVELPHGTDPVKIESLAILDSRVDGCTIAAVADDDKGGTEALILEITL